MKANARNLHALHIRYSNRCIHTLTICILLALLQILDIVREFFWGQVRLFVTYERQA